VIVPDRHGSGTNALLLAPPDVIEPAFGPDSARRHRERAAAAGAHCQLAHPRSLLLDVDTASDLDALRAALATHAERAERTRALLARAEPAAALGSR
jgi:2-phospho-L-lactate guanylyltransferase